MADIGFNFQSLTNAQLGRPDAVKAVAFSEASPGSLTARFVDSREASLFFSALRSDPVADVQRVWFSAECLRFSTSASSSDSQTVSRFERLDDDSVLLSQKVATYLTPLDANYFEQPFGVPVAVYQYETRLTRVRGEDGSVCVEAPDGLRQCAQPLPPAAMPGRSSSA